MLKVEGLGKHFQHRWVFKDIAFKAQMGTIYYVAGENGAGKSTLLKVLSGYLTASKGKVSWENNGHKDLPKHEISYCAPYIDLVEDFTLKELVQFHWKICYPLQPLDFTQFATKVKLLAFAHQQIKQFSSGMKQRLKLGLTLLSPAKAWFFDEPCSNLDAENILWYQQMLHDHSKNKLVIVGTNHPQIEAPGGELLVELTIPKS